MCDKAQNERRSLEQEAANLIINHILPLRGEDPAWDDRITPEGLAFVAALKYNAVITAQIAKRCILEVWNRPEGQSETLTIWKVLEELHNNSQISVSEIVAEVIVAEPKAAADYRAGKKAAISHLMGIAVKLAGNSMSGKILKQEIEKQLNENAN